MNVSVILDETAVSHFAASWARYDLVLVKGLLASVAALVTIALYHVKTRQPSSVFRNREGKSMIRMKGDTRFRRFINGEDMSDEGHLKSNGDPFMVWNGWTREVVINSPEQTRDFFYGDAKDHVKPPALNMGRYFERLLGLSVVSQNGDQWKATRNHFDPNFSHNTAAKFISLYSQEMQNWLKELSAAKLSPSRQEHIFETDAVEACATLPYKLIGYACYGDLLDKDSFRQLLDLNKAHEWIMGEALLGKPTRSKWYNMLPTHHKRAMDQFQKDWKAFNMGMVQKSRDTGKSCPIADSYANTYPNSQMREIEWLQTIDEIMFTNINVTSSVLAFLLINLAATESVQEELREEIRLHLSTGSAEELEAYIAKPDMLLEYTYTESTRLCPATWFSLPEYSPNTKRIGGFLIPAQTPVIVDWMRLNTMSPVWNRTLSADQKEPITGLMFHPHRFASLYPHQYRYSFLQYGMGPRKCIGRHFVAVIMKMMLIVVLSEYRLEFTEEDRKKAEERRWDIRDDRFIITPRQVVRFVKRE